MLHLNKPDILLRMASLICSDIKLLSTDFLSHHYQHKGKLLISGTEIFPVRNES